MKMYYFLNSRMLFFVIFAFCYSSKAASQQSKIFEASLFEGVKKISKKGEQLYLTYMRGDQIFTFDQKTLTFADITPKKGKGPGEMIDIGAFAIGERLFAMADNRLLRITIFDNDTKEVLNIVRYQDIGLFFITDMEFLTSTNQHEFDADLAIIGTKVRKWTDLKSLAENNYYIVSLNKDKTNFKASVSIAKRIYTDFTLEALDKDLFNMSPVSSPYFFVRNEGDFFSSKSNNGSRNKYLLKERFLYNAHSNQFVSTTEGERINLNIPKYSAISEDAWNSMHSRPKFKENDCNLSDAIYTIKDDNDIFVFQANYFHAKHKYHQIIVNNKVVLESSKLIRLLSIHVIDNRIQIRYLESINEKDFSYGTIKNIMY